MTFFFFFFSGFSLVEFSVCDVFFAHRCKDKSMRALANQEKIGRNMLFYNVFCISKKAVLLKDFYLHYQFLNNGFFFEFNTGILGDLPLKSHDDEVLNNTLFPTSKIVLPLLYSFPFGHLPSI